MSNEKIVVFDTNAYREFVQGKSFEEVLKDIKQLKENEAKKNIHAYPVMIVGLELLSHLNESEDRRSYKDCLNGIIAMSHHCSDDNYIVPPPFFHIANSFFHNVSSAIEENVKNIGAIINNFKISNQKDCEHVVLFHKENNIENIKKQLADEEKKFANDIECLVDRIKRNISEQHPNIEDEKLLRRKQLEYIETEFESFYAQSIIFAVSEYLNEKLESEEIIKMAEALNLEFSLATGFMKLICKEIMEKKIDMQTENSKKEDEIDYEIIRSRFLCLNRK